MNYLQWQNSIQLTIKRIYGKGCFTIFSILTFYERKTTFPSANVWAVFALESPLHRANPKVDLSRNICTKIMRNKFIDRRHLQCPNAYNTYIESRRKISPVWILWPPFGLSYTKLHTISIEHSVCICEIQLKLFVCVCVFYFILFRVRFCALYFGLQFNPIKCDWLRRNGKRAKNNNNKITDWMSRRNKNGSDSWISCVDGKFMRWQCADTQKIINLFIYINI